VLEIRVEEKFPLGEVPANQVQHRPPWRQADLRPPVRPAVRQHRHRTGPWRALRRHVRRGRSGGLPPRVAVARGRQLVGRTTESLPEPPREPLAHQGFGVSGAHEAGTAGRGVPGARRVGHGGLALHVDRDPVIVRRSARPPGGRGARSRRTPTPGRSAPSPLDCLTLVEAPVGSRLVWQLSPARKPADVGRRDSEQPRRLSGREKRIGRAHAPDCEQRGGPTKGWARGACSGPGRGGRLRVRACARQRVACCDSHRSLDLTRAHARLEPGGPA